MLRIIYFRCMSSFSLQLSRLLSVTAVRFAFASVSLIHIRSFQFYFSFNEWKICCKSRKKKGRREIQAAKGKVCVKGGCRWSYRGRSCDNRACRWVDRYSRRVIRDCRWVNNRSCYRIDRDCRWLNRGYSEIKSDQTARAHTPKQIFQGMEWRGRKLAWRPMNFASLSEAKKWLRACAKCTSSDSSHACPKSHLGTCAQKTDSILSNYSVSGQRKPWSDCADAQADLAFAVRIRPKTRFRMARPKHQTVNSALSRKADLLLGKIKDRCVTLYCVVLCFIVLHCTVTLSFLIMYFFVPHIRINTLEKALYLGSEINEP